MTDFFIASWTKPALKSVTIIKHTCSHSFTLSDRINSLFLRASCHIHICAQLKSQSLVMWEAFSSKNRIRRSVRSKISRRKQSKTIVYYFYMTLQYILCTFISPNISLSLYCAVSNTQLSHSEYRQYAFGSMGGSCPKSTLLSFCTPHLFYTVPLRSAWLTLLI